MVMILLIYDQELFSMNKMKFEYYNKTPLSDLNWQNYKN